MDDLNHKKLLESHPGMWAVLPSNVYEGMLKADSKTADHLLDQWKENIKENIKRFLPSCGWLNDGYIGIGRQKAVIGIGSGPSLSKNKDYLKTISLTDGTREYEEQDFILMSSNHQLKQCFKDGIIPHFAMLSDGSPDLADQMDVGATGKHTTLVANIICHPDVIAKWKGPVKFVCTKDYKLPELVAKITGEPMPLERCVVPGGNILNLSFALAIGLFRASVWMCVGNDLSFSPADNLKDRRKGYYEDGDYSSNIKSRRDEASNELYWGAFDFPRSVLWTPSKDTIRWRLKWACTAPQLFFYKTWLEANAMILWKNNQQFHIYNCTEGGILGVLLKEDVNFPEKYDEKFSSDSWFLMDEVTNGKWRTRTLEDACEEFYNAKQMLLGKPTWQGTIIQPDVPYATNTDQNIIH
jgi:hypothetical protein